MFHVKHRRRALLGGVVVLALLTLGCGLAAGPRGWAPPVPVTSKNLYLISTGRGHLDGIAGTTSRGAWRFPDFWTVSNDDLDGIYGPPVLAQDGDQVFVGDYNGVLYGFKISEAAQDDPNQPGLQVREGAAKGPTVSLDLKDSIIGGLALDESKRAIYVTVGSDLVQVNYGSGALSRGWSFKTDGDIWGRPTRISGGRILVGSLDGKLYAVNEADGTVDWTYSAGKSGLVSTPAVAGDTVFVGGFDSKMHAVDLATGNRKWTYSAKNWVWTEPYVESGRLIFGDFAGYLYAVSTSNGTEEWEINLKKGEIVSTPVLAQGTLVVTTRDGWVVGIDPSSREIRWETKIDKAITADPIVSSSGDVIIAPSGCLTPDGTDQETYFYAISPANGELKQALDVC
jgi:outer membrane protein assembly factor BamB